jgi:hypothetical protein
MKTQTTKVNIVWTKEQLKAVTDEVVGCTALHYAESRTFEVVIQSSEMVDDQRQWTIGSPTDGFYDPWVCKSLAKAVNKRTLKIYKDMGVDAFVSDIDAFISRCVSGVLGPWLNLCPDARFISS